MPSFTKAGLKLMRVGRVGASASKDVLFEIDDFQVLRVDTSSMPTFAPRAGFVAGMAEVVQSPFRWNGTDYLFVNPAVSHERAAGYPKSAVASASQPSSPFPATIWKGLIASPEPQEWVGSGWSHWWEDSRSE